jgi:(p)ppGpp synthase/HD superfamily hydrolase
MYIKLADRLDNVMTLKGKSKNEQKRLIAQTRAIYLPLAAKHCILFWELTSAVEEIEASWDTSE